MGTWEQVKQLAADTPKERNRYVDFLRAVSIMVVIVGHWLIATTYNVDGTLTSGQLFGDMDHSCCYPCTSAALGIHRPLTGN